MDTELPVAEAVVKRGCDTFFSRLLIGCYVF